MCSHRAGAIYWRLSREKLTLPYCSLSTLLLLLLLAELLLCVALLLDWNAKIAQRELATGNALDDEKHDELITQQTDGRSGGFLEAGVTKSGGYPTASAKLSTKNGSVGGRRSEEGEALHFGRPQRLYDSEKIRTLHSS